MNGEEKNKYTVLSLGSERFAVTAIAGSKIVALESRELVHRFGLISFQDDAHDLEVHLDTITALVTNANLKGQRAGIVIGEDMVLVKRIPVALGLDEEALKEHLEWEAEQILLSPVKDFRLVSQRLPTKTPSGNPFYLVVMIRKQVLQGLRTLVESADLQVQEIEVDVFSHLRALNMNYIFDKEDTVVLIRIQAADLHFIFITQREYFLSHHMMIPRQEQLDTPDLGAMIKKELRRLVFGHRLGKDLNDLKKVYIYGSLCSDELIQQLKNDIPVAIEKMNPLKKIVLSSDFAQSQEVLRFPDRFAGSIGLALKAYPQLIRN